MRPSQGAPDEYRDKVLYLAVPRWLSGGASGAVRLRCRLRSTMVGFRVDRRIRIVFEVHDGIGAPERPARG